MTEEAHNERRSRAGERLEGSKWVGRFVVFYRRPGGLHTSVLSLYGFGFEIQHPLIQPGAGHNKQVSCDSPRRYIR